MSDVLKPSGQKVDVSYLLFLFLIIFEIERQRQSIMVVPVRI